MKFEISYPGGTTHEVELPGVVAVLGRDPACDVVLNDTKCSRRHATVEDGPKGLVVRDSGSANGVYVNGRRVNEARLRPGDVFRLGDVQLKVLAEVGETVVMAPDDIELRTAPGAPRPPEVDLPLRDTPPPPPPKRPERGAPGPRPPAERRRTPARAGRPMTVTVLAALWALFVPTSVAACLLAAHRLGGGALAWFLGGLAGLVLAGLGTSIALGLRALAPWARHLQVATAAVGILVCPLTLASATVLLYVTRPEVRAAFEGGPRPPAGGNGTAEATFSLSLLGMLVLGLVLTAVAALLL
jgi:hypothetical protein